MSTTGGESRRVSGAAGHSHSQSLGGSWRRAGDGSDARSLVPEPAAVLRSERASAATREARRHLRRSDRLVRGFNVALATVSFAVVLPLMGLIALLIKLTTPGPVLYVQTRVGIDRRGASGSRFDGRRRSDLGGKPFKIYKFRTMYDSQGGQQVWTPSYHVVRESPPRLQAR
jgi:lipopolysaccharide/colanic/teichoic acid biosynthesis glycosyltransferase